MSLNIFNSVQLKRPKKNVFDLSHDVKLSLDFGQLVPIMVQECVPGDHYTISCDSLLRFAPMIAPIMHRVDVTMHYFFVPNRILWDGWEKWISGDTTVTYPYAEIDETRYNNSKLFDYMGIPPIVNPRTLRMNPMALAAYQCIYNEYYRDQNLIPEVDYKLVNGANTSASLWPLRHRAWQHDYFTSALPFAQKGPTVDIPIAQGTVMLDPDSTNITYMKAAGSHAAINGDVLATGAGVGPDGTVNVSGTAAQFDPNGTLITESGASSITDLRRAFRLQEWLEKNARAGTRYVESLLAHFGVKSSDARLNRPEYITGTKSPVVISEVLNTTGQVDSDEGAAVLPQGNMAGHGISVTTGKYGKYFCEEHGYIIGVMSVMPLPAYQDGVPKHFLRSDRFDFFWPEFANIGEQEILNKELYFEHDEPDAVFGYVPRYAEYKYTPSRVCGDFRNNLAHWHLGRMLGGSPTLSQQFIECTPQQNDRIFAVQDSEYSKLYCQVLNKVKAVRPMPKFGTPFI